MRRPGPMRRQLSGREGLVSPNLEVGDPKMKHISLELKSSPARHIGGDVVLVVGNFIADLVATVNRLAPEVWTVPEAVLSERAATRGTTSRGAAERETASLEVRAVADLGRARQRRAA